MRNSVDVIIVGAGIVGAAAARALAAAGRKVLVLRRGGGIGEASPAAAGMLAAQIESHDAPGLQLALAARDRHVLLAAELRDAGHDVGHQTGGILQVALDAQQESALRSAALAQRSAGLDAEWLAADRLRQLAPGLSTGARGALLAPRDGCVNNVALAKALERDAVRRGAMVEFATAERLLEESGRVRGVKSSAGDRIGPIVLLAAGAWSPQLRGLPRPLPVRPVRGQMLRLPWPEQLARGVYFGPAAYIVPRAGDALLGSTMEEAGFDARPTPEGTAAILRGAAELAPPLAELPPIEAWAGLRPVTSDGRPILGADPELAGLFYATGHGRNGILLGPLTAELVAGEILSGESRAELKPYGILRFADAPGSARHHAP